MAKRWLSSGERGKGGFNYCKHSLEADYFMGWYFLVYSVNLAWWLNNKSDEVMMEGSISAFNVCSALWVVCGKSANEWPP